MNRREAIARLAVLMGGAVVGAEAFLRGEPLTGKTSPAFTEADRQLLDEIGETIIPTTSTPGAKSTGIGAFMIGMVNDCYDDEHHAIFQRGLRQIDEASRKKFGKTFLDASPAERTALLNQIDRASPDAADSHPYFRLFKQLAVLGYFTSETGCTEALRYVETPGAYRSDPYKKGDRAWYIPSGTPGTYGDTLPPGKAPA